MKFRIVVLFLMTALSGLSSLASDLEIRSELYSTHDFHINGMELFDEADIPADLKASLSSHLWKTEIPVEGKITIFKNQISAWLREIIVNYNKTAEERVRLIIPEKVMVYSKTFKISPKNIRRRITTLAKKQCKNCDFEITFFETIPSLPNFSLWKLSTESDSWKGRINVQIHVGEESYELPVRIRWYDSVVTAKYQISVGKTLSGENLTLKRTDVTFSIVPSLRSLDAVLGMRAAQIFRKGQVISRTHLKKPQLIRYGQIVTISLNESQFSLSMSAKSKGTGAAGDIIPVEILKTKKRVMAEVIDSKSVRIQ